MDGPVSYQPLERGSGSVHASHSSTAACVLFLVWLEIGYAAALRLLGGLPWIAAGWQGAACIAAIPVLLFVVLEILTIPKRLGRLPREALAATWALTNLVQFALPWLGWAGLVWLVNRGTLSWAVSLRSAAGITILSYLTGVALILRFRPAPEATEVTRLETPISDLPVAFDGYRILHLSDLHAGPLLSVANLRRRLAAAGPLGADLVAFTGDLADSRADRVAGAADLLSELAAVDGIVAVLGNHDIWVGEGLVGAALTQRGVKVLVNAHTWVSRGGARLYLAGVSDASYTGRDDLRITLAGIPEDATIILLSHAPGVVRKAGAEGAALVLSGHTHGGQLVLPWVGPLYVPSRLGRRYASGLHRLGAQWLFITRGLGEVFPPLRIGCPPEVALLTLRAAPSG